MSKLDKQLTMRIQAWLDTPKAERDLNAGATMMFQLNHNRALYNSALQRPERFADKVEYELKKFLKIRLADMSVAEVVELEKKVMPAVDKIVNEPVIDTSDEWPEATVAKGKRADHDLLPPEIQKLWDDNGRRYRAMNLLFNELKAMSDLEPCDRFAKLQVLAKTEQAYREALAAYDGFVLSADEPASAPPAPTPEKPQDEFLVPDGSEESEEDSSAPDDVFPDPEDKAKTEAKINAARKTISKYRKRLSEIQGEPDQRAVSLEKIQNALYVLRDAGAGIAEETAAELASYGLDVAL